MKHTSMFLIVAMALGGMGVVHAQDSVSDSQGSASQDSAAEGAAEGLSGFDGRWYIAPTVGAYFSDSDRNTNSRDFFGGIGFGRFISSNTSFDIFADYVKRDRDGRLVDGVRGPSPGSWSNATVGVDARYFFGQPSTWRPFVSAGVGTSYHKSGRDNGFAPMTQAGFGVQAAISQNLAFRAEADYRYYWNEEPDGRDGYGDAMLSFSLLAKLGSPPVAPAPVEPAPAPVDCSTLDSDQDGVNNCEDKCPDTAAGTIVGPDGCPQKVVIDLRGVNFKFDRPRKGETDISGALAAPSSDSIAILDQAIDTLQRYPQVHVTVAGYTDSVGTDAYNQKLSERRARIVYDYLTGHGIDASRLDGPIGHGENDPIGDNQTKDGRAQNRRTELQVQQ